MYSFNKMSWNNSCNCYLHITFVKRITEVYYWAKKITQLLDVLDQRKLTFNSMATPIDKNF